LISNRLITSPMIPRATPSGLMIDNVLSISHNSFKWIFDPRCDTKRASSSQHRYKYFRFFSNFVGEEGPACYIAVSLESSGITPAQLK
jgi:hypothetical protein